MIKTHENYCCVIENKLYFGNKILATNEEKLKEIGIKSIVDLIDYKSKSQQIKHSTYFKLLHLEIEDIPTNNINWAEECSKFIEEQINNNNPVYVHCAQGISRSTTLIMHYLMTRTHKNCKESFLFLKNKRIIICPNIGFIKSLCELDEKLFGKKSFTFEEYSLFCLKESFPSIPENEINDIYEKNKKYYNENKDLYNLDVINKHNEPIGYKTINDLWEKFGKKTILLRKGCSIHHPFD